MCPCVGSQREQGTETDCVIKYEIAQAQSGGNFQNLWPKTRQFNTRAGFLTPAHPSSGTGESPGSHTREKKGAVGLAVMSIDSKHISAVMSSSLHLSHLKLRLKSLRMETFQMDSALSLPFPLYTGGPGRDRGAKADPQGSSGAYQMPDPEAWNLGSYGSQ